MNDLTFLLPCRIESEDRLRNVVTSVTHLLNRFPESKVLVKEVDTRSHFKFRALPVIKKYADPGIIRQAMGLLVIKQPYVVQTAKEGAITTYTMEGMTAGTSSEIPSDVLQVYKVSWENGKIISIEFKGPKKAE